MLCVLIRIATKSKTGVYRGIHFFLISAQKHRLWVLVRIVGTGVYRGIHFFLISAQKHRLWVLVRTASSRRF